jgi:hypothetical protein
MTWAQRLKRVFNINIQTCSECGGAVKVIACNEDSQVIKKILDHMREKAGTKETTTLPEGRRRRWACSTQETVPCHRSGAGLARWSG